MAKEKPEEIVVGSFQANGIDGDAEARLSDGVSNVLLRDKKAVKGVELNASYELVLRKVAGPPAPATVTATIRAEDVGSLPNDAVIEKSEPVKHDQPADENNSTADEGSESTGSEGSSSAQSRNRTRG